MPNPKGINQYTKGGGGGRKKRSGPGPKLKKSMKGDPFRPQGADARKKQGRRI
jgi:hypothetical protein